MDADTRRRETEGEAEVGLHTEITGTVIGAAQRVHTTLGYGFPEKVYENALAIELRGCGLLVEQSVDIVVRYQGHIVGSYEADMLVERKVILEIKAISILGEVHEVQVLNYLRATEMEVGLLINFGDETRSQAQDLPQPSQEGHSSA